MSTAQTDGEQEPDTHVGAGAARLSDRLQQTWDRMFVGRSAELQLLREALEGRPGAPRVLFLVGPGGMGKSTLLRRYGDEARASGRNVVRVDGRAIVRTPAGFESAAVGALAARSVLLVDTFEACQGLEGWLREQFLPRLPGDTVVVIAGRLPPGTRWRVDPAWCDTMRVVELGDLSSAEASALLAARGIPEALHPALIAFAGGHPLALTLAAVVTSHDGEQTTEWLPSRTVLETLLQQVVDDVPSPAHRRVLEVCAHALNTTQELLRATVGDQAEELFDWLSRQPYVESGPHGLYPHDLVRELLNTGLRWRDPQGWEAMHRQIRAFLIERALTARGPAVTPAMMALNYLHRNGDVASRFLTWRGRGEVYEDTYRPEDKQALIDLARESADAATADLVAFWLGRQPEAFTVHRLPGDGRPAGFLAQLRLSALRDEEAAADPTVAAIWAYAERAGPLRSGEHITIGRFIVQPGGPPLPSPTSDLVIVRSLAEYLHSDLLAWSFVVLPNPDFWEPLLDYLDHRRLDAENDDQLSGVFAHDWRLLPKDAWLELTGERLLYGRSVPGSAQRVRLPRTEFDTAVREALRGWHHPAVLSGNPLVHSPLVGQGTLEERVSTLRKVIEEAIASLGDVPRLLKSHRVLTATYLKSNSTQEAAAARLNMPISTYRRHLAAGLQRVTEELLRRESHRASL